MGNQQDPKDGKQEMEEEEPTTTANAMRLIETADLSLPIRSVPHEEIFVAGEGTRRRHLAPDADDDCERTIAALSATLSAGSAKTYAPWIRLYWSACASRSTDLHDLPLFRGFIKAIADNSKPSTTRIAVAAIVALLVFLKRANPKSDPATMAWLRATYRQHAASPKQAEPILLDHLYTIIRQAREQKDGKHPLTGYRDAALILIGWSCALRRSEIAALQVGDILPAPDASDDHHLIAVRASKTDQNRKGAYIPLYRTKDPELDAYDAVMRYLGETGITSGPIFRKIERTGAISNNALLPPAVNQILKKYEVEGLTEEKDGKKRKNFQAHSLRSGFVTQASLLGRNLVQIQNTTRHASLETVKRYLRQIDPIRQGTGPLV